MSARVAPQVVVQLCSQLVDLRAKLPPLVFDPSSQSVHAARKSVDPGVEPVEPGVEPRAQTVDSAPELEERTEQSGGQKADRGPSLGFHGLKLSGGCDRKRCIQTDGRNLRNPQNLTVGIGWWSLEDVRGLEPALGDRHRIVRTSTSRSSFAHVRSLVSTGKLVPSPRARHVRSPSDCPRGLHERSELCDRDCI